MLFSQSDTALRAPVFYVQSMEAGRTVFENRALEKGNGKFYL